MEMMAFTIEVSNVKVAKPRVGDCRSKIIGRNINMWEGRY